MNIDSASLLAVLREEHLLNRVNFSVRVSRIGNSHDAFLWSSDSIALNDECNSGDAAVRRGVPIGCFSHSVASIAALSLHRSGRLQLDEPLHRYLTELNGSEVGRLVRIRDVLSQTAGYRGLSAKDWFPKFQEWNEVVAFLASTDQIFQPGLVYDSQRLNTIVLWQLISRVCGTEYRCFLRATLKELASVDLVEPISDSAGGHKAAGMENPLWRATGPALEVDHEALAALGQFAISPNSGVVPEQAMIDVRVAAIPPLIDYLPIDRLPEATGLGVYFYSRGFVGSDGSGASDCFSLRINPKRDLLMSVIVNSSNIVTRARIVEAVYAALGIEKKVPNGVVDVSDFDFSDFTGSFHGMGRTIVAELSLDRSALELSIVSNGGQRSLVRISSSKSGKLVLDPSYASLALFRDPSDDGPAILLGQNAYKCYRK